MKQDSKKKKVRKGKQASLARHKPSPNPAMGFWEAQGNAARGALASATKVPFWKAAVYDLLMLFLLYVIISSAYALIYHAMSPILPELDRIEGLKMLQDPSYEDAYINIAPQVYSAIKSAGAIVLVSYVLGVFVFSLFSLKAWLIARGQKFAPGLLKKAFLTNLVWFTGWFIVATVFLGFLNEIGFLLTPLIILFFLISDMVLRSVMGSEGIFMAMRKALIMSASRFQEFLLASVIIFFASTVSFLATGAVAYFLKFTGFAMLALLLAFVMGFARNFFIRIVGSAGQP